MGMFTYQFNFINSVTGKEDETQFCAENKKEAEKLFFDFCKNDLKMSLIPKYSVFSVYNKEDAEWYGSEYGEVKNHEPMTKERMKELLDAFVEREFVGRNAKEAYQELLHIGFTADELIYDFNSCKSDVREAEAEMED